MRNPRVLWTALAPSARAWWRENMDCPAVMHGRLRFASDGRGGLVAYHRDRPAPFSRRPRMRPVKIYRVEDSRHCPPIKSAPPRTTWHRPQKTSGQGRAASTRSR